jgi:uncharacterized protein
MKQNLLLIFIRNPELGKVKTRLAAAIGDKNALEIYQFLLLHTRNTVQDLSFDKRVMYSDEIIDNDIWSNEIFDKQVQFGQDLGTRMKNAFADGFDQDYDKIVIIGSDLYDLETANILEAFDKLDTNDVVIGPAKDGGYYLLGLKNIPNGIFINKNWGTNSVLKDTLADINHLEIHLLEEKNDIDTVNDIKGVEAFKKYLL